MPTSLHDLTGPNTSYQHYAAIQLVTMSDDVTALRVDLAASDLAAARSAWLAAQMDWERVGASYDSFGDNGQSVDGLPDGLPGGVEDQKFTGLHRIEYGLYHGQTAAELLPLVDKLATDVQTVQSKLATDDEAGDPTNLPLRVHEILEDALRDHLSKLDDEGSGMAYAETAADTDATITVLDDVAPLIEARKPHLVATITTQLHTLHDALDATKVDGQWQPHDVVPFAERQRVDAAMGATLETLSIVPDLLEVPPSH
jgi:high-affinity iron transporter